MAMRKMAVMAVLAAGILGLLAPGVAVADETASATLQVKLSVRGMTCSGCAGGVKTALEKVPGVTRADVSLEKNEASVTYRKDKTTPEELVKAVESAGFKCSLRPEK
jgi:mercuric transport protein